MTKVFRHLHQNVIAYLALFVALGGTSYAAINIPKNSVGGRQIRNHSIDPVKLNGSATAGFVLDWAQIDSAGHVVASRPRRATTPIWNATPNTPDIGGEVSWRRGMPSGCFALASASGPPAGGPGVPASISADLLPGSTGHPFVAIQESEPSAVNVAVICPIR
ncbi:MAG: hypothetical protein M3070_18045 [Actinomycetota bacterium]|nr:hypothetical protein [Actinomycetota bacterium]